MKLIIQIALGIVLAVVIIKSLTAITGLVLLVIAGGIVYFIIYFIYDKLTAPVKKRHYEESRNFFASLTSCGLHNYF